jgi:hypothetical protein
MATIHYDTLLGLADHFLSEIACLAFAFILRVAITRFYPENDLAGQILLFLDDVMAIGVVVWLLYQLGVFLWKHRERINSNHVFVVA